MKLVKQKNEFGVNIFLKEENKYLAITFGGNGDLYWAIHSNDVSNDNTFVVTKENYGIYVLFEQLFSDVEEINIFDEEDIPYYMETEEEINEYIEKRKIEKENEKKKYILYNQAHYNELFDQENKVITWYSDETAIAVANILKIEKESEYFKLKFCVQEHVDGYDDEFNFMHCLAIRFRNSGSRYDPFNFVFMKMYNGMKKIDDVNDVGHQVHIEEYIYIQNKMRKLTK